MKDLRVVFMGTPGFAVASLGSLLINEYNVIAVVTAPDKPAGRGRVLSRSPVREFAESHCLHLLQPHNLKDPVFIRNLIDLNPDIFVVVAFRMLPEAVWKIPPMGTVNLHASLLPQYRGSAPVNHAIINGESVTGLTTFLIDDKIDTGNILLRDEVPILPNETAGSLHDRLMKYGARLIIRTLAAMAENKISPQPQSNFMIPGEILKTAPKIFPEQCIVDWNSPPVRIHNLIRGLSPSPAARSEFIRGNNRVTYKIFESLPEEGEHDLVPGAIVSDGKSFLKVACKGGFVRLFSIQAEGRKRLDIQEFLRGFRIDGFRS